MFRALSSFDELDFTSTKSHLDSIQSLSLSSEAPMKVGPHGPESSWWDVHEAINTAERAAIRATTLLLTSSNSNDTR
jgi:hypothetical protein